jgi:hypothetical protein
MLQDVKISGTNSVRYPWAGITCLGDATLIIKGTNAVWGFQQNYPGIHVPTGATLTITGSGSLVANSNGNAAGIGGGYGIHCGNIVIAGGTITANGAQGGAGIGGGGDSNCGDITITDGVTKVTASTWDERVYSIGANWNGTCGTITIGGNVCIITTNNYTYEGTGSGSVDPDMNLVNPMFKEVTISDAAANVSTDYVDFIGTYSPVSIYTAGKTNLYLGADNTLYYPTATDFQVNAFRGYFQLKLGDSADPSAGVRAFVLNFGDGEATGIISVHDSGFMVNGSDVWYTLDGRKLDGKPTQRGIYINNGKKTIIK